MRAALLFALLASQAHAACSGDEVFSCRIGPKTLEVCHRDGTLHYAFGREGRPELTLSQPLETAAFTPWPGIGRTMWDSLAFLNDGVTYEVWAALDKQLEATEPEPQLQGGVNVMQGDRTLASLTCDPGSVSSALDTIGDLKAGIGQCWNMAAQSWGSCT